MCVCARVCVFEKKVMWVLCFVFLCWNLNLNLYASVDIVD